MTRNVAGEVKVFLLKRMEDLRDPDRGTGLEGDVGIGALAKAVGRGRRKAG